jgi:hypothetical protein
MKTSKYEPQTALLLLRTQRANHTFEHWQHHHFMPSVVMGGVRYCCCAECYEEMCDISAQWQRDYESMMEDLRASGRRFLGFDILEEWERKTGLFTPL